MDSQDMTRPAGHSQRGHQAQVLLITSLAAFMAFLDMTIVNIAFPSIARSFPGTSLTDLSWVLNAYNIVFAAFLVPVGRFADLVGRKRMFQLGTICFIVGSVACALAPSADVLIGSRVVQAAGAATLVPASLALLLPEFPFSRRSTVIGLWGGVAALASGIGPSLGGFLISVASWRLVFLVNVPVGIVAVTAGHWMLTESRDPYARRMPDVVGAVVLAAAVGLLALGIVRGGQWGWWSAPTLVSFAGAVVLGVLFVFRSADTQRVPVVELSLLRMRPFAMANLGSLLFGAAFYGAALCNVLFLTSVWHYSLLRTGLAVTPSPLTAVVFGVLGGRLADRFGHRVVSVPGCLLLIAGVLWYVAAIGVQPAFLAHWLVGSVLFGAGVGLAFPVLGSAAATALPMNRFATGTAVNSAARQIGAVLGVALLVAVIGTPSAAGALSAFRHGWVLAAIAAAAAIPPSLAMGRRIAEQPGTSPDPGEVIGTGQPAGP